MSQEITSQEQFDYSIVSNETADRLKQDAVRGRILLKRTAEDMIELGHILLNGKETLPHGQFIPWAKAEFNISQSTAWRFMQIAQGKEIKQSKSFTVNEIETMQISEAAETLVKPTHHELTSEEMEIVEMYRPAFEIIREIDKSFDNLCKAFCKQYDMINDTTRDFDHDYCLKMLKDQMQDKLNHYLASTRPVLASI